METDLLTIIASIAIVLIVAALVLKVAPMIAAA